MANLMVVSLKTTKLEHATPKDFLSPQFGTILVPITQKILIFLKIIGLEMFLRISYISKASFKLVYS